MSDVGYLVGVDYVAELERLLGLRAEARVSARDADDAANREIARLAEEGIADGRLTVTRFAQILSPGSVRTQAGTDFLNRWRSGDAPPRRGRRGGDPD